MYPPKAGQATNRELSNDLNMAHSNLPFVVRNIEEISSQLGDYPLPHGFTAIPQMNSNGRLSFFTKKCPFVQRSIDEAMSDPETFSEYSEFIDDIRSLLGATLPLTEE